MLVRYIYMVSRPEPYRATGAKAACIVIGGVSIRVDIPVVKKFIL